MGGQIAIANYVAQLPFDIKIAKAEIQNRQNWGLLIRNSHPDRRKRMYEKDATVLRRRINKNE